MNSKTLALIITYNPNRPQLIHTIRTLNNQVDLVLIFDNSETRLAESDILKHYPNLLYNWTGENRGISQALECAFMIALSYGLDYVITMDQDSDVCSNIICKLKEGFSENDSVAIVAPIHSYQGLVYDSNLREKGKNAFRYVKVDSVMSSGCLVSVKAFLRLKRGLPNLFIDCVDHYLCLSFGSEGYQVLIDTSITMEHRLGSYESARPIGPLIFYPTHHPPFRYYYITRNRLYTYSAFLTYNTRWCLRDILKWFKEFVALIIFNEHKTQSLLAIYSGAKDFVRGKSGKKDE